MKETMEPKDIGVRYDRESDLLEVTFEDQTGSLEPTENDHVMVRLDDSRKVIGFSVFDVTKIKAPSLNATLKALPPPAMLTTREAAQELGVTQGRLRHLLAGNRVKGARRVARDWMIPAPVQLVPGQRGPVGVAGARPAKAPRA